MADFNEYKGVWVFCEQRQGKLMPTDFELVSEARKLADELNCEVTGLLLGDNVDGIAKELGGYGADKVMVCDSPLLKDYTTDAYAKVVCDMVNEYKPEVLLIGATNPVPLLPSWSNYFSKLNRFQKQLAEVYDIDYIAIPYAQTELDGHPTVAGHKYIAKKIVRAIQNG